MRYFFLIYALVAGLVIGIFPFRGQKTNKAPFMIFPDMDVQDKVRGQKPSHFFSDGMGARQPVESTVPNGFGEQEDAKGFGFSNDVTYYHTGMFDETNWGQGMPAELGLTADNYEAFLRKGKERFEINCKHCHGVSGNGEGTVSKYGFSGIANINASELSDGQIYDAIANGRGMMPSLQHVSLEDRWAIVAYVRALQLSRKAPYDQVKEVFDANTKAK